MELLSLAAASSLRAGAGIPIWSDCSSAISVMMGPTPIGHHHQQQLFESGWPHTGISKVKAHPERRLKRAEWTLQEQGIFNADLIASDDHQSHMMFQRGAESTIFRADDQEMSEMLMSHLRYLLVDAQSGTSLFSDPREKIFPLSLQQYKAKRDVYRATATPSRPPKWKALSQAVAGHFMKRCRSISSAGAACRIIWDKNWTGYNQAKGGADPTCLLCGEAEETQNHIIRRCSHPRMIAERAKACSSINSMIRDLPPSLSHIKPALSSYREIAYEEEEGYLLWTGHMSDDLSRRISDTARVSDRDWSSMKSCLEVFFEGTMALYQTRRDLLDARLASLTGMDNAPLTRVEKERARRARYIQRVLPRAVKTADIRRFFPVKPHK
jgi:hypothetical protein